MSGFPRLISAVLTENSVRLLKEAAPPKFQKVFIHHVTLAYNPSPDTYTKIREVAPVGSQVVIKCIQNIWDDGVQAVSVEVFTETGVKVFSTNKNTHITISTNGKPPKYSNDLLDHQEIIPKDQKEDLKFLDLRGIITYEG